jgi:hypothetical protein
MDGWADVDLLRREGSMAVGGMRWESMVDTDACFSEGGVIVIVTVIVSVSVRVRVRVTGGEGILLRESKWLLSGRYLIVGAPEWCGDGTALFGGQPQIAARAETLSS